MQSAVVSMLDQIEPEAPNRFVVLCSVTGGMSQHITKVQAVLGYSRMLRVIGAEAPKPSILEWVNGEWRAV